MLREPRDGVGTEESVGDMQIGVCIVAAIIIILLVFFL